jgi:hypothetical protein
MRNYRELHPSVKEEDLEVLSGIERVLDRLVSREDVG